MGHFWQGRFKSQLISDDPYFIQCGRHIELNPVKARMVEKSEDYLWSSSAHYIFGKSNKLLTDDIFYAELGSTLEERQKRYSEVVVGTVVEEYMDKADTIAIGDKRFVYNSNRRAKYHENHRNSAYRKRGS